MKTLIISIFCLLTPFFLGCTLMVPIEDPPEGFWCNDGELDEDEECDGDDFGDQTCASLGQGFSGGFLNCSDQCTIETHECTAGGETNCTDEIDNDGDGAVDCADSDCQGKPPCEDIELSCTDGIDNDGDGVEDCYDSDCQTHPDCDNIESNCTDGQDNDDDGQTDCADSDCANTPECLCGNGTIDGDEECDGVNGSMTCAELGFYLDGTAIYPVCNDDCTFDVSMCPLWEGEGVGGACGTAADCTGFNPDGFTANVLCISEYIGTIFPGGYCSTICSDTDPYFCESAGGDCLDIGEGAFLCVKPCLTVDDCRGPEGYECLGVVGDSTGTYCVPAPE